MGTFLKDISDDNLHIEDDKLIKTYLDNRNLPNLFIDHKIAQNFNLPYDVRFLNLINICDFTYVNSFYQSIKNSIKNEFRNKVWSERQVKVKRYLPFKEKTNYLMANGGINLV